MIQLRTIISLAVIGVAVFGLPLFVSVAGQALAQSSAEQERTELEAQLKVLEAEIALIEGDINRTQAEKDTLTNKIGILRSQIRRLDLQIEQSNLLISDLRSQISDTFSSIERTETDIEEMRDQMSDVIRHVYQENQRTQVEIILASPTLSDFFTNVAGLGALNARLEELLSNLVDLNQSLGEQYTNLEFEKEEEESFIKIQLLQKQESQSLQSQTQVLLQETAGKEAEYQRLLADTQQKAQEIRTRIFELIGVPNAPTFGEAVEIAKWAGGQAGVRPALVLAILSQESNLGKNVGQCYIGDIATGTAVGINSGRRFSNGIHPTRDLPPFLVITKDLGRNPLETPVSCPIPSVGGYGGAMGPAQFIPSTWMLYKSRLDAMLGRPADPWNIRDAFLASATYLADSGATTQTYEGEWCAAQRYFSGRCSTRYRFYGDSVLNLAAKYQRDITTLDAAR